ncbi:MAG: hypothetical protein LCH34_03145 [Firmicutes bacterium]|nr:hypothetical protein [Bacillota bacterium]
MGDYKLTRKGIIWIAIGAILAMTSLIKGSIYLAVFSFVFFSLLLAITLYEVFLNR